MPFYKLVVDLVVLKDHVQIFELLGLVALKIVQIVQSPVAAWDYFNADFLVFLGQPEYSLAVVDEVYVSCVRHKQVCAEQVASHFYLDPFILAVLILVVKQSPVDQIHIIGGKVSGIKVLVRSAVCFLGHCNQQNQKQNDSHSDFDVEIPALGRQLKFFYETVP